MAKKLGKLFLFSAAVGAIAGSAYYYLQHRDSIVKSDDPSEEDDDFDDFSEDLDEEPERNYVDLDFDAKKAEFTQKASGVAEKVLEKTADCLTAAAGKISETAKALDHAINAPATPSTEEFFDDEDEEDPAAKEAAATDETAAPKAETEAAPAKEDDAE